MNRFFRVQLLGRSKIFIFRILTIIIIVWSFQSVEFTREKVIKGFPILLDFISKLYPPNLSVAPTLVGSAIETIQMVIAGTFLGMLLALPFGAMAASNIAAKHLVAITRTLLMMVRTIPSLVWALIFVIIVGLGPFAGVLALTFYTLGYLGKNYYEIIETIDMGTVEGVVATGASRTQVFIYAILPQFLPHIVNNFFFMIEYNIRHAAILGFVGAGGFGFYLFLYLQSFQLDMVAMALLVLFGLVLAFDRLSLEVRRRVI